MRTIYRIQAKEIGEVLPEKKEDSKSFPLVASLKTVTHILQTIFLISSGSGYHK